MVLCETKSGRISRSWGSWEDPAGSSEPFKVYFRSDATNKPKSDACGREKTKNRCGHDQEEGVLSEYTHEPQEIVSPLRRAIRYYLSTVS